MEKVELVVGRPFSRVYLAQSHVTMNTFLETSDGRVESNPERFATSYISPRWIIYNCDEIMCKELYHILLIFVLDIFLF